MSNNVYGFENYRGQKLIKDKSHELHEAVKDLARMATNEEQAKRYAALSKLFSISAELSSLKEKYPV